VRDARVRKESFQVRLRQRCQISVDQSKERDHDDQALRLRQRQEWLQYPKQHDESGRLRTDGKIRSHRCRCALVNIRHPDLEGHRRDLETERHQDKYHA
jgi:hypothetical protein